MTLAPGLRSSSAWVVSAATPMPRWSINGVSHHPGQGRRGIAAARALSVATVANMKQNLGFAFIYNSLGVPVAAGVLFPFTGLLLSPLIAALAMSLSSVSVIANALRLRGASGTV